MKTFKIEQEAIAYSVSNPLESVEFKTYWDTGNLWGHCFYVNGKRHGEYKSYWSDGNLWGHCFYVNGLYHGEFILYHSNGKLREHSFYVNGKTYNVDHLRDGSYKSLCILSTLFNGNLHEHIQHL